ncbi:MAG: hypothetical protein OEQ53_05190 [Saprospiraceae bacterium]|nr:hypothetical protein [Saprospiraceae bacterium]
MKIRWQWFLFSTMIFAIGTFMTSCSASKRASAAKSVELKDPVAGTWDYEVSGTPDGTVSGQMVIMKEGDSYKAKLTNDMGEAPIDNLVIDSNALNGSFDFQGFQLDISGDFEGEAFNGEIGVEYTTFPMVATRRAVE